MMTKETRIIFEPADVLTFQVRCTGSACQGAVSIPLTAQYHAFPERCPICRERWPELGDRSVTIALLDALRDAVRHPDKGLAVHLAIAAEFPPYGADQPS